MHRDLKPDNLFLTRKADGRASVKVLDFGISKVNMASSAVNNLTGTTAVLGTPYYMAPEQLTSTRSVDARADIWALGVVLYELISSALPFHGETLAELCIRIVQDEPIPLTSLDPNVPSGVWSVVARCLQKNREARFANVAEVAFALAPYGTASARLSTDTISRIIPGQLGGLLANDAGALEQGSKQRTDTISVEQTRVVTGHTAWGQTNATAKPKSRTTTLLVGALSGILVLAVSGWFLRSTVLGTSKGEPSVGSNSAAGVPTAVPLGPPSNALDPVQPAVPVVVHPTLAANTADQIPSAVAPGIGDAPRTARGVAPVIQPNRPVSPEAAKRPGSAAAEPGSGPKVNPENLIDDRR